MPTLGGCLSPRLDPQAQKNIPRISDGGVPRNGHGPTVQRLEGSASWGHRFDPGPLHFFEGACVRFLPAAVASAHLVRRVMGQNLPPRSTPSHSYLAAHSPGTMHHGMWLVRRGPTRRRLLPGVGDRSGDQRQQCVNAERLLQPLDCSQQLRVLQSIRTSDGAAVG